MLAIFTCSECQDNFYRKMADIEIAHRRDLGQIPERGSPDSVDLGEALCDTCADVDRVDRDPCCFGILIGHCGCGEVEG